jgi:diguanylate cyclase (GGDEF)-like protein
MLFAMTEETQIILTMGVMVAMIILTIFLIFGVRRDKRRFREDKSLILDGLLSRTAITSEINAYLSRATKEQMFSLMSIEIDNFDDVINAYGKPEAKKALERVAYFMARALPKKVLMSNFQTTHFLVFMKSEYDRMQCQDLAKKLLSIIRKPIKIYKDASINMSGSIGIAYYPLHGTKFKELTNSLAIALQEAKAKGGDNIFVYGEKDIERAENLQFYMAIKEAMENKQFVLFYQPIIDINNEKFYGVEALVRWNHPEKGLITPQNFLDIMEQSGDIKWIGIWGLETLIQEYYEVRRQFPYLNYQITLNLSTKQLLNDTIVSDFTKLIKKYKMKPEIIILEIADFSAYQKHSMIKQNIAKLKKFGFKISLNAYGIDSNTLLTLNNMPIDVIKLDRQFFTKEEESYLKERLLDLIVQYGKKNNKDVIAEGIEDEEMVTFCKDAAIDLVQGYFYSKPISSTEIINFIHEESWVTAPKIVHDYNSFEENPSDNDDLEPM